MKASRISKVVSRAGIAWIAAGLVALILPAEAEAQHSIDVERLTASSQYFDALINFSQLPKRRISTSATISAAKSAWALSLPEDAIEHFEQALLDRNLDTIDRARLLLSRAIIDYQESRYPISLRYAQQAYELLPEATSLRARVWLLIGENHYQLVQYGAAQDAYAKAREESDPSDAPEIEYRLGLVALRLGQPNDAAKHFEQVPLQSERAAFALRQLAQISLDRKEWDRANVWLTTGRREFPESFLDSWVDYAHVRIAIGRDESDKIPALVAAASGKYPASDEWLTMLVAAAEAYQFERLSRSI